MSRPIVEDEIAEQPAAVARLLDEQAAQVQALVDRVRAAAPAQVLIVARGTSDNAARYAQHLLGRFCGLPVALATPSLQTIYGASPRLRDTFVLGISQSGGSPDLRAVVEDARRQGQPTAVITNAPESPLALAADQVVDLAAGTERSIAATKSYTASLAAVAALAAGLADDASLASALAGVPDAMTRQLARTEDPELAAAWDRCALTGRGPHLATAHEGALKIKELTGIGAEASSPADLLHGPIAAIGPANPLVVLATSGPALSGGLEVIEAGRARDAAVVAVTDRPALVREAGGQVIEVEELPDWLSPFAAIIPLQRLAVRLALARGVDVDLPFGLSKVTQTT